MGIRQGGCLCALTIVLLAGCGGAGDSHALDAYRHRLASVCRTSRREVRSVAHYTTYPEFVVYILRLRKTTDHALAAVRKLKPPASVKSLAGKLEEVDAQNKSLVHGLAQQVLDGQDPRDAVTDFRPRSSHLTAKADALFRQLDVPACVS